MTQTRDIRHPWLRSRSRQRPVAVLLIVYRTLRKSNILHSHKPVYIFAPHAIFVVSTFWHLGLQDFYVVIFVFIFLLEY